MTAAHVSRRFGGGRRLAASLAVVSFFLLTACTRDDPNEVQLTQGASVEELYNQGANLLESGSYLQAAAIFDEVERRYPYSVWSQRAQLMAAYAYYLSNQYDDALTTLDRFIQLHPGNDNIAYAYYLRALSYYEQISDVRRDQRMTRQALESLDDVIRRFPETSYARDAKLKRDLAVDHLAGKEMEIGRYYLGQGNHLAAINRFRTVITNYQTTTHVPEALHRLVEAYVELGVYPEAQATAAVLGHNYPGSEWYADSYYLLTGVDLRPAEEPTGDLFGDLNPF